MSNSQTTKTGITWDINIGARFKDLRKSIPFVNPDGTPDQDKKGLTLKEFTEYLNNKFVDMNMRKISQDQLKRVENNEKYPSVNLIFRIAKVLDFTPDYFLSTGPVTDFQQKKR